MPHFKDAGTVFFVTPTHCATGRVTVSGRGRSGTVCWAPAPGLGRGLGPGCCAARLGSSRLSTLRLCQTEGRSRSRAKPAKPHQSRCLSGLLSCQRRPACSGLPAACGLRPCSRFPACPTVVSWHQVNPDCSRGWLCPRVPRDRLSNRVSMRCPPAAFHKSRKMRRRPSGCH